MNSDSPFHIAIIPDGNRRWAKQHGLKGYKELYDRGVEGLLGITQAAFDGGVTHLSLWGSSHANLADRSSDFFSNIDRVFRDNIHRFAEHPVIEQYDVRINIIGEWRDSLTPKTIGAMEKAIAQTAHRKTRELTLLIDYSGNRERTAAVHSILTDTDSDIATEQLLRSRSWTGHLPDLDLIVRTGSWTDPHNSAGFMSLLADETQFSFPELLWPEFTGETLANIIMEFNSRERRRGK
ncbi:undecaprenyl diphosphate synthase family protein [Candidatus Saccharibacteria bacterium]|nr:undecaprenyl diphosphate synthase family protein [Candidatus Saccharibacteria bacterium]MBH1973134.1 undecaprenyl diphosphate synthase family protein [Candidatus Saccharibacteria bacterium]MBH1990624.1 undecaprenyl diphosphate synthase family protein [Candidatus Saccharibacteria bacterium]